MRPPSFYICASAIVLATAVPDAQKPPDFNGQWVLDEKRTSQSAREQESRTATGGDALLTHTPRATSLHVKVNDSLTLTWSGANGKQVDTWTLDGVDRSTTTAVKTSAEWKGRTIEIKLKLKGAPPVRTELSMDGAWLVIKDTQHDRESEKDSAYRSRRTYYRKSK
jgi:hypothetical protein